MSEPLPELINDVVSASADEAEEKLSAVLANQDFAAIALLLESLPLEQRLDIWRKLPNHKKLDVLVEMRGDARELIIKAESQDDWQVIFNDIDAEDLLEILDSLPQTLIELAYSSLDNKQQQYFTSATQYPDEQIGHWLSHDILVLPQSAKVRDANRLLKREIATHCDSIFLVNRAGQFAELVKIVDLFALPEHIPLVDLSLDDVAVIKATDELVLSSQLVQRSGLSALPVVDDANKLMGRLDIMTACELMTEFYERQVMSSAGMDENEDLFSPVLKSTKNRALWLGINLITAFLASFFIAMFEATLQQVVALAVLMPIVASMGGIAGSQTLTLIIRGLALNQVSKANRFALLKKELQVGGFNGIFWALVIGIVAYAWFADPMLGVVIAVAILCNVVAAAFAGVFIPIILVKLKIDPALSGSVILTTVTDIVGFVCFLGLGTLVLV